MDDGWIRLVIDYDEFKEENLSKYTEIGLVYFTGRAGTAHEKPLAVGVAIDWGSIAVVEGYIEPELPEFPDRPNAKTIVKGSENGTQFSFTAIEFSALEGKAIHFEFYFKGEGSVAFALADDWHNATGSITLTYEGSTVTADKGIVYSVGDGWWAWEHNFINFGGDGMNESSKLDVIMKGWGIDWNADVAIDLDSFRAVEANDQENPYPDRPNAVKYEAGASFERHVITPVLLSAVKEAGAISIELKLLGDGEIVIGFLASDWAELAYNTVIIKNGDEYTSFDFWNDTNVYGRITVLKDGWIRLVIDYNEFKAENLSKYAEIGLVYFTGRDGTAHEKPLAVGVAIDWGSIKTVEGYIEIPDVEFPDRPDAIKYDVGTAAFRYSFASIPLSDIEAAGAIRIQLKLLQDGAFSLAFCAPNWAEFSWLVVITKDGDSYTSTKFYGGGEIGKINPLEDGWIELVINYSEFNKDTMAAYPGETTVAQVFITGKTVNDNSGSEAPLTIAVGIDWASIGTTSAYEKAPVDPEPEQPDHSNAIKYDAGTEAFRHDFTPIELSDIEAAGAISIQLKMHSDGAFSLAFCASNWGEFSWIIVITKNGDSYTSTKFYGGGEIGKINLLEDGWIEFVINFTEFNKDTMAAYPDYTSVAHVFVTGKAVNDNTGSTANLTIDVSIDWNTIKTAKAYRNETSIAPSAVDGEAGSKFVFNAITVAELEGKAIHFEFRFEHEGTFAFAICGDDWKNATGSVYLTYAGGTVTASVGRVYSVGDGWWAWEHNFDDFGGDGFQHTITQVETFMKGWGIVPDMEIFVDLLSFRAVDAI